jgi:hypothetical protein
VFQYFLLLSVVMSQDKAIRTQPCFVVQLAVGDDGQTFGISPNFQKISEDVQMALEYIVVAGGRIPRIDGKGFLGPCEMFVNDDTLDVAKQKLCSIVMAQSGGPEQLLDRFNKYACLFNGEEEKNVTAILAKRQSGSETRASLKTLGQQVCALICISVSVSLYLFIYISIYACIYVSPYLCIYVSMYLCIYVSMYLCIYVSMYLCIYVSMYPLEHVSRAPTTIQGAIKATAPTATAKCTS